MTMRVFEFKCQKCGNRVDEYIDETVFEISCIACADGVAKRIISAPRIKLEGWSGHFPTAASKWERQHENAAKGKPE